MRALKFIAFEAKLFIIDATKIAVKAIRNAWEGRKGGHGREKGVEFFGNFQIIS